MKKAILASILVYLFVFRTSYDLGVCLNESGDGRLYNNEPYYNYISYSETKAKAGDEVFTVCFLNPLNLECDDVLYRFDYVR